jgi:hypothetical protein
MIRKLENEFIVDAKFGPNIDIPSQEPNIENK